MAELDILTQSQENWVPLTGLLTGVKLKVRYASPTAGEEFQRILDKKGFKDLSKVPLKDYLTEFCTFYITDWDGPTRVGQPAPYDPSDLAKLMVGLGSALEQVLAAVRDEANFFFANGKRPS